MGRVKIRAANGDAVLSPPFDLDVGGIQGGMSTPWTFILATTEVLFEDSSRRHDLDYEIRRECLRLEIAERRGEADSDAAAGQPQQGDCTSCGAPMRLCVCDTDELEEEVDPGLQRWNSAVKQGGAALFAARATRRTEIEKIEEKIATRGMRPARWEQEADAIEAAGTNELTAEEKEAMAEVQAAQNPDERLASTARFYNASAARRDPG